MKSEYFINREVCSCCHSTEVIGLYRSPLDENPIKSYLESFYAPQGGVDFHYLKGADYALARCAACGLLFQTEVLADGIAAKLYGEWIDPVLVRAQHRREDDLHFFATIAQEIMQIVCFFDAIPSRLDFLDFGMGLGQWAIMAKAFGCNVTGLELTGENVFFAKANGISVIEWHQLPSFRFDFINAEQVFEHLTDPLETLSLLTGALKPNGVVKISVPTALNIEKRLKKMDWSAPKHSRYSLNPVAPLEHINYFTRKSLLTMAQLAGLHEIVVPVGKQYRYLCNWSGARRILSNLLQPVRRNLLKDQNYALFRRV